MLRLKLRTLSCELDHSCNDLLNFVITAAPKRLCVMIWLPDHNVPTAYIARLGRARNRVFLTNLQKDFIKILLDQNNKQTSCEICSQKAKNQDERLKNFDVK